MKTVIVMALAATLASQSGLLAQEAVLHFTIKGDNAPDKIYVSAYVPATEQNFSDSIIYKQGSGVYRFPLTDVAKVSVALNRGQFNSNNLKSFYVGAGQTNILINESGKQLQLLQSALDKQYKDYESSIAKEKNIYEQWNKKYGDAYGNKILRDSLRPLRKAAWRVFNSADSLYARRHPDSWFSLNIVNNQAMEFMTDGMYGPNPTQVHEGIKGLYNNLGEALKLSPLGKRVAARVTEGGATLPGNAIIDFSLPALDGSVVETRKMRGQIYLIDFWGSWCTWCRKGHPHMKELYAKYQPKGLEIIAVAVEFGDKAMGKAKWLKAIEDDGIPWKHVLNNNDIINLPEAYGVRAYPTKLLVDEKGTILLRVTDDNERKLDAKLEELFGAGQRKL